MVEHAQNLVLPDDVERGLRELVPHWHICVRGPVPFGQLQPVLLKLDHILAGSREEAEQEAWYRVYEMCQLWKRELDEEEWALLHCIPIHQN